MAAEVDVKTLKDRGAYYKARAEYLNHLLSSRLSPKQRREAEFELNACMVKAIRFATPPDNV